MKINEAKRYFQQNPDADLLVVPRQHKYVLQLCHHDKIVTLNKGVLGSEIACDTLEQVNDYAKKLDKFDYKLIQNNPHVEVAGFDQDGDAAKSNVR